MKTAQNFVPKILMALLIIGLLTNCKPEDKEKTNDENGHEEESVAKRPEEAITLEDARTLYLTYEDRRVGRIGKYEDSINRARGIDKKFDVARFVQFDYNTIKNYIAYIEKEAKEADVAISGLRIYFANNPEDDVKRVHPRQNSVMLSPTTKAERGEAIFGIDKTVKGGPKAVLLNYDFTRKDGGSDKEQNEKNGKMEATMLPTAIFNRPASATLPFQDLTSLTLNKGNSSPPLQEK